MLCYFHFRSILKINDEMNQFMRVEEPIKTQN
jgi:hypothetical protein